MTTPTISPGALRETANLTGLLEVAELPPVAEVHRDTLLALIDTVEVAGDALWDTTRHGEQTRTRLAEALERFTP